MRKNDSQKEKSLKIRNMEKSYKQETDGFFILGTFDLFYILQIKNTA